MGGTVVGLSRLSRFTEPRFRTKPEASPTLADSLAQQVSSREVLEAEVCCDASAPDTPYNHFTARHVATLPTRCPLVARCPLSPVLCAFTRTWTSEHEDHLRTKIPARRMTIPMIQEARIAVRLQAHEIANRGRSSARRSRPWRTATGYTGMRAESRHDNRTKQTCQSDAGERGVGGSESKMFKERAAIIRKATQAQSENA